MIASLLNICPVPGKSSAALAGAVLALVCALAAAPLSAQQADSTPPADRLPDEMLPPGFLDTSRLQASAEAGEKKSPGGAMLRALAIPGWGQYYTGHPVRGTVTAVAETAFFTLSAMKYRDADRLHDRLKALEAEMGPEWPEDDPQRVELNRRIKDRRLSGGDFLAYGVTSLLLAVADSFVSAHLYDFNENLRVGRDERGRGRLAFALEF